MQTQTNQTLHLHSFHQQHANLTTFHGFSMPLYYEGIVAEHLAVRNAAGIFDVTHMGRAFVQGPQATDLLHRLFTYDVAKIPLNTACVTSMCTPQGAILDNFMVYRLPQSTYFLVYNCLNRTQDEQWIRHHAHHFDVNVDIVSDQTPHFAIQGPSAADILSQVTQYDVRSLNWLTGHSVNIADVKCYLSRTGYTGEDGFELYIWDTPLSSPGNAQRVWQHILQNGSMYGLKVCGLGARDTLRIEAGFWLEGNECNGFKVSPLELGIRWAVDFSNPNFIGRDAILKQRQEGLQRQRVGIKVLEPGIPRAECEIWANNRCLGHVTSGTFSPLLRCGIAIGYVPPTFATSSSQVHVKIRNKSVLGQIVPFPFYDSNRYGRLRETGQNYWDL